MIYIEKYRSLQGNESARHWAHDEATGVFDNRRLKYRINYEKFKMTTHVVSDLHVCGQFVLVQRAYNNFLLTALESKLKQI